MANKPDRGNQEDDLSRIGVAIPGTLLDQFDSLIEQKGYSSRSEAFRDMIRSELVERSLTNPEQQTVGTVTLVYDHHIRQLNDKLTGMQHHHYHQIVSTTHIHLDHDNCLEVVILRGTAAGVQKVADALIATKGIRHGKLVLTTI